MRTFSSISFAIALLISAFAQAGVSAPFSYQGALTDGGLPANGNYDFRFQVFNAQNGGGGSLMEFVDDVTVSDGVFSVELDFNNTFDIASDLFMEVSVRPAGSGSYVLLAPRQPMQGTPRAYVAMDVVDGAIDSDDISTSAVDASHVDVNDIQLRVGDSCATGSAIRSILSNGSVQCESMAGGSGDGWSLDGNSGTSEGNDFLGTTDDVALDIRVDDKRAMRFEWGFNAAGSPNITGGHSANSITDSEEASVIAGGGLVAAPNTITSSYSFIGGGVNNQVTANYGSILGGSGNVVSGNYSVALGRSAQALHDNSFVFNDGGTFATTAPDQFLIDAAGGVGIGLNNPSDFVHISAPAGGDAFRIQLGGTTRLRVHDNGGVSVGVNAGPPAGGLLVQGEIRGNTAVTRWLQTPASAWMVADETVEWETGGIAFTISKPSTDLYHATAPVQLPHGAVITQLRARVRDNQASGNQQIRLARFDPEGTDLGDETLAVVSTNGSIAGIQTLTDSSISFATIDNENYEYYLTFQSGTADGNQTIYGTRITYTTTDVY